MYAAKQPRFTSCAVSSSAKAASEPAPSCIVRLQLFPCVASSARDSRHLRCLCCFFGSMARLSPARGIQRLGQVRALKEHYSLPGNPSEYSRRKLEGDSELKHLCIASRCCDNSYRLINGDLVVKFASFNLGTVSAVGCSGTNRATSPGNRTLPASGDP